jgi:hypothetical protein
MTTDKVPLVFIHGIKGSQLLDQNNKVIWIKLKHVSNDTLLRHLLAIYCNIPEFYCVENF